MSSLTKSVKQRVDTGLWSLSLVLQPLHWIRDPNYQGEKLSLRNTLILPLDVLFACGHSLFFMPEEQHRKMSKYNGKGGQFERMG